MKLRLGLKISLLLILFNLTVLVAVSYKFITVSKQATESLLKEYHIGISDEISRMVQSSLDANVQVLDHVIEILNDHNIPDESKVEVVQSAIQNSGVMDYLAVYDEAGKLIDIQKPRSLNIPNYVPENLSEPERDTTSRNAKYSIITPADSLPYFRLIVPWYTEDAAGAGRRVGYLLTTVPLAPLSKIVAEISQRRFGGRPDQVYVLDTKGNVIAHSDPDLVKSRLSLRSTDLFPEKDTVSVENMFRRDIGYSKEYTNLRNHEVLASFATISKLGIGTLIEEPVEYAFAAVNAMTRQLLIWCGMSLLASIVIGIIFSRTITRPIRHLVSATQQIAGGEYGGVVPISTNDEVAELTSAFNTMSVDLRKTFEELKQANDYIVQAEKMAIRGEIAAEVSHELKNFFQILLLQCNSMTRNLFNFDPEKFKKQLIDLEQGLIQMNAFAENLLVRSGSDINIQQTDVNEMLKAFTAFISVLPKYKYGTIDMVPSQENYYALLDIDQIRQVLLNLSNNAIEAFPNAVISFFVTGSPETNTVKIIVSDNGPGIAPEVLSKLFKEKITTKKDGHGFGLSVTRKNVEAMNGTISIESSSGKGSTFTLTFPLSS